MADPNALLTYIGVYTDESEAEQDYEVIKDFGKSLDRGTFYDAALVRKHNNGKVQIVHTLETSTRRAALEGAGIGLAVGLVAALFPAVALTGGLVAGSSVGGSVLGAVTGHVTDGMPRGDLKELGEALDAGENAIVVIAGTQLESEVAGHMPKASHVVEKQSLRDPGEVDITDAATKDKAQAASGDASAS